MDSLAFPEAWELLSFFEGDPELLDPQAPWYYNALTFRCVHADEVLTCTFSPSYGELAVLWTQHDVARLRLDLHDIVRVEVLRERDGEWLRFAFNPKTCVQDLRLAIKPHVRIFWGT